MIAMCCVFFITSPPVCLAEVQPDKKEALAVLQKKIQQLKLAQKKVQENLRDHQKQLRKLEKNIGHFGRRVKDIQQSISQEQAKLDTLNSRRDKLNQELVVHKQALARQVRAVYGVGRQEQLKLLLNQQDPSKVSRMLMYYDYLNQARTNKILDVKNTLDKINQLDLVIQQRKKEMFRLKADVEVERDALDQTRGQRKIFIASLNKNISSREKTIQEMLQDEQQLISLITDIQKTLSDLSADFEKQARFSSMKGQLSWQ